MYVSALTHAAAAARLQGPGFKFKVDGGGHFGLSFTSSTYHCRVATEEEARGWLEFLLGGWVGRHCCCSVDYYCTVVHRLRQMDGQVQKKHSPSVHMLIVCLVSQACSVTCALPTMTGWHQPIVPGHCRPAVRRTPIHRQMHRQPPCSRRMTILAPMTSVAMEVARSSGASSNSPSWATRRCHLSSKTLRTRWYHSMPVPRPTRIPTPVPLLVPRQKARCSGCRAIIPRSGSRVTVCTPPLPPCDPLPGH